MKKVVLVLMVLILLASVSVAGVVPVRVKFDRVILRLQPSFKASVISQVDAGEILSSTGSEGEWVQVLPPEDVFFWVFSRYVTNNVIIGHRVRVRTGPGVAYPIADELQRGEHVVSKEIRNDWVKIKPPKGCPLWVHKTLVERIEPEPKPQPPVPASPAPKVKSGRRRDVAMWSVATDRPSRSRPVKTPPAAVPPKEPRKNRGTQQAPAALVQRGLVPLAGQGEQASYEGVLLKTALLSRSPARFRLVRIEGKRKTTICHVMGNKTQLSALVDSVLVLQGRQYWLIADKYPVLVVERIVIRERVNR